MIGRRRIERIFREKTPPESMRGQWRSIEFEMIFNSTDDLNAFVKFAKEKKYDHFVTIKEDGSIDPGYDNPDEQDREVVVSYPKGKEQIVRDICRFWKGRAYVNKSCGTHVHFDMRGVPEAQVALYGKRLANCVSALRQIIPKSRRNNHFCYSPINAIDGFNRYAFVNMLAYKKHETIEVRGHSGTLNASKILNWIKICETIMESNLGKNHTINTPGELIEYYKFDDGLVQFINKRAEETNTPPKKKVKAPQEQPASENQPQAPEAAVTVTPPAPTRYEHDYDYSYEDYYGY